ncbi:hypothetical protein ACG7TL_002213 [Trametes sanguinea]
MTMTGMDLNAHKTSEALVSSGTLSGHVSSPIRRVKFTAHTRKSIEELTRVHRNPAFFHDHLKACPASLADAIKKCSDVQQWIADITEVETKEASPCEPVAKLLSKISETVFMKGCRATASRRSSGQRPSTAMDRLKLRRATHLPSSKRAPTAPDSTVSAFQVIYLSPAGIEASELTDWSECSSLCAYIYSLYDPPADHVLYDHTIIPKEPAIFRAVHKGRSVIVKESFDCGRHYEGELLTQVHADGFLPGVVRHIVFEDVKNGDEPIAMRRKDGELTRKKRPVVLADPGEQLTSARSVNDVLMAIYDTPEGRPLLFSSPINFTWRHKMPELSGDAHDLYLNLRGERRNQKYRDRPGTVHGGVPPLETDEEIEARARELPFSHRWEYDADGDPAAASQTHLDATWTLLSEHFIPSNPGQRDPRDPLLAESAAQVAPRLLPAMAGAAPLLPSYTVMTPPPPHDDHLHEAMQRLILQYLVDNLDKPIPLIPGRLRPVANGADPVMHRGSYRLGRHAQNGSRGLKRRRDASDEVPPTRRSIRAAWSRGGLARLAYEIVEEEEP